MRKIKDKKVKYIINNYLDKIKDLFSPQEIWVWGSRIYGTPTPYSDVDMIIVSPKFGKIRFLKRRSTFLRETGLLYDKKAEVVDALCYSPEEFERRKNTIGIVSEALVKGIRIA
jgi:predicted nucleotidyltransferase